MDGSDTLPLRRHLRGGDRPQKHEAPDLSGYRRQHAHGKPVFISQERWDQLKNDQRSTVSAQMLLNPIAGSEATFSSLWLKPYEVIPAVLNVYILVDPSMG